MLSLLLALTLSQGGPNLAGPATAVLGGKLADGKVCGSAAQCVSGFCSDSVCCATACSGACDACSVSAGASVDGTCANVTGAGSPTCSPYVCSGAAAGCPSSCSAHATCATGSACVNSACGTYVFSYSTLNPSTECAATNPTSREGVSISNGRGQAATCTKADGTLVSVPSSKARINNNGILVETNRANSVIRTRKLDTGWTASSVTVTANSAADPFGTTTAEQLNPTGGAASVIYSTTFTGAGTSPVMSYYAKTHDGTGTQDVKVQLYDTIATTGRGNCTASVAGTWTRYTCAASSAVSANASRIEFYPDIAATDTEDIDITAVQVESTSTASAFSSYIETDATSESRDPDYVTVTMPSDISATGCAAATFKFPAEVGNANYGLTYGDSGGANWLAVMNFSYTNVVFRDGTTTLTSTIADVRGRTFDVLMKWGAGTFSITADGVTASGSFDGSLNSFTTLGIGAYTDGVVGTASLIEIDNIRLNNTKEGCN